MTEATFHVGDLVVARFRPDNVGRVEKVYGGGGKCDLYRPGKPNLIGVPVKALAPVPADAQIYAVGVKGEIGNTHFVKAIVLGRVGLESWMQHATPAEIAACAVCLMRHNFAKASAWVALTDLIVADTLKALGIPA